ncbi:phage tail tape measure protein [uncultured Ruminococcus sp.]|uniref:phage tail tape measure protein n=1 Tax=uncultured Ruminococcus sp. TaxID=165186 RepID=UPI0025EE65EA|nr:phage tail tape measure protein [uncultured Ruminococcus sp.]
MAKSSYKGITVDITFQGNTSKFNESVSQIDRNLKTIDNELKQVNKDLRLDPTNANLAGQKFDLLAQKIKETKDKLALMRAAQDEISAAYSRGEIDGGAYRDFQRELGATEAQLNSLNAEVKRTADTLTADMKKAVADLNAQISGMVDIIKKAELALIAFSAASAKVGANFDSAMSQVAATLQTTAGTEEYEKLSAAAKQMGETTSYSAAQAAFALNSLAQAGYTADESIERLPKTLALAKAGGLDLASAAKIVTQSMASLQLGESDLDKLLDEMARTAQKSNTNIAELGDAIRTVGGTMDMAGQSMETMFTELGMLANAGVSASEAGTHLRNVMLALVKTDVQEKLHDMGVEVTDSTGKIRDLADIMTDLAYATKDMQSGELLSTFGDLFNVRDLASVNALLNGTKGSMQALRAEIENSQGAASQMAETMGDNLTGDITILKSAFEGLQIAISDKLTPSLRKAAHESTDFIGEMSDDVKSGKLADDFERLGEAISKLLSSGLDTAARWLPTIIDLLTAVAEHFNDILAIYLSMQAYAKTKAIATAIGEIITSVISLTKTIKGAQAAQEAFNVAAAANPVGAIATAAAAVVGALTFGIIKATTALDDNAEAVGKVSTEMRKYVDSMNEYAESVIAANHAHDESLEAIENEKSELYALTQTIYDLSEKQKLSGEEYETLNASIAKINEAVPMLNLAFDDQTDSLNMTKEAVMGLVESYTAYEDKQARVQYGIELAQQKIQLQEKRDELIAKREELKAKLKHSWSGGKIDGGITDRSADVEAELHEITSALISVGGSLRDVNVRQEENNKALEESSKLSQDYQEELDEQAKAEKEAAEASEKDAKAAEKLKTAYSNAKTAVSTYKSELKDLLGVLDNVNKGTAYSTSQILDLIDKYPQLTAAIHASADGYIIEADAVRKLTQAKADDLVASSKAQLAALEAQKASLGNSLVANVVKSGLDVVGEKIESQIAMYQQIADDISNGRIYSGSSSSSTSSSGSSSENDWVKERKEAAKAEEAELENQYKTEKISAEEYYNGLMDIAQRYYAGLGELREEYLSAENKVYEGLKKAQEDELSTAKKLEDQLRAVKDAEDALNRTQNQKVQVFSGVAGFHAESDTAAITKAQQTLADKNYNLAETLLKSTKFNGKNLTERLQSIGLTQIRDMLPDLSGLTLPTLGGTSTTNNSTRNITYNGGDISINIQGNVDPATMPKLKTSIEDAVRKGIEEFLDEENALAQTGGI